MRRAAERVGPPRGSPAITGGPLRAVVVAAALASLGAPPPAVAQLRGDEVRTVRFEGNTTFPRDSLARAIVTQETDCRTFVLVPFCWIGWNFALRRAPLRERELPLDRARLTIWYQRRGFLDVQIDTPTVVRRPGEVEVTFRVSEGRPVLADTIGFEGVEQFLGTGLLDDLPLREGARLSTLTRDATRDTLIQRLRNRGRAHADVLFRALRPAEDPYRARVTFAVEPGPLTRYGAIDIQGTENLDPGTVRRALQFSSGDLFSDEDLEDARDRLFGLEIVRSARVEPDLSARDSIVPVTVAIQEGDSHRVRTGGGWSTDECLSLDARWTSRNFLGGGRLLQLRGRLGNLLAPDLGDQLCNDSGSAEYARLTWVASVDLRQPWILSSNNSLTTSVFAERQTLPDIFIRRAIGFGVGLTRALDARTALTLFYRPELSELDADDVLFCTGFLVCTPEDISLLEGANWLAPVGLSFTRDRSDDLLNPRRGSRVSFELEHAAAWTGSNFRYDRAVAEVTRYEGLGGAVVLAGRLRGGWVGRAAFDQLGQRAADAEIVHPQRRFFAGGANSVRGFAQSRLGPRVLFVREPTQLLSERSRGGAGCKERELVDLLCDVGVAMADAGIAGDSVFFAELPTGGTRVIEGNAEVRFPIGSWLEGVAFTDVGQAWVGGGIELSDFEITPGFGVRFPSPVGPIRIDLAYRPRGAQTLSVITPQIREWDGSLDEDDDKLEVDGAPIDFVLSGGLALLPEVLFLERESRFQLHVSIGQAF